jgi:hypothetical protein
MTERSSKTMARMAAMTGAVALAAALAGTTPAPGSHRAAVHPPSARLVPVSYQAPAEFSRPPAPGYQPLPVSGRYYRYCLSLVPKQPADASTPITTDFAGYGNANKEQGSFPVGMPGPALASGVYWIVLNGGNGTIFNGDVISCSAVAEVQLDYDGARELPPIRATFQSYGFVPVTATATLVQYGKAPVIAVLYQNEGLPVPTGGGNGNAPYVVIVTGSFELRISDVDVNGVPLDVGPSCRTDGILSTPGNPAAPGELMLSGGSRNGDPVPAYASVLNGGSVAGLASIPPFTGCVSRTGEDLDALITSSISGTGDYVKEVQGRSCVNFPGDPTNCTSTGLPEYPLPLFSITHGGDYTGSAPMLFDNVGTGFTISCTTSNISGSFPDSYGPERGAIATVFWTGVGGCTGSDGTSWTASQAGTGYFAGQQFNTVLTNPNAPDRLVGAVADVTFSLSGTGKGTGAAGAAKCHAVITGYNLARYMNPAAGTGGELVIAPTGTENMAVTSSDCLDLPATTVGNNYPLYSMGGSYLLTPSGITIEPDNP